MKNGLYILYQCFCIAIYGIAVALLFIYSNYLFKFEHQIGQSMYQQHVITCTQTGE